MKSFLALPFTLVAALFAPACADGVTDAVDPVDAAFLGTAKADGTGIDEGSPEACAVLAAANKASAAELDDDAGLDARAAKGIVAKRPFANLAALDAVAYVGPIAFERLSVFAEDAGYTCATPGGAVTCTAPGGTYDGVSFSSAAECRAVAFLNGARMSDMRGLPDVAWRAAYEHCGSGEACTGYRFTGWKGVREFADRPGVANAGVKALATAALGWTASEGPAWDTVVDVWARRTQLIGAPVNFEKVFVTRGGINESGGTKYACVEVRDAPDAPNYIDACVQYINADSAPSCSNQPEACLAPFVGKWVWMRGTVRKSSAHAGGYKVNLIATGPRAANPALLNGDVNSGGGGLDDAWRAAAIAQADRLVTDGPLPAATPATGLPAAVKARVDVFGGTSEVSVIETYKLTVGGHVLYLVLATDGSGEGNLVWVDLVDETGKWFAHGIAHTLWDGGGGLVWSLDEEDTTLCKCASAGEKAVCTWLDGTTSISSAIVCE